MLFIWNQMICSRISSRAAAVWLTSTQGVWGGRKNKPWSPGTSYCSTQDDQQPSLEGGGTYRSRSKTLVFFYAEEIFKSPCQMSLMSWRTAAWYNKVSTSQTHVCLCTMLTCYYVHAWQFSVTGVLAAHGRIRQRLCFWYSCSDELKWETHVRWILSHNRIHCDSETHARIKDVKLHIFKEDDIQALTSVRYFYCNVY